MTYEEYSCNLKYSPAFKSSTCLEISNLGKNLLEGMLNKNIKKRFTLEQIANHPWVTLSQEIVTEVKENFSNDMEKVISELNKRHIKDVEDSISHTTMELEISGRLLGQKRKKIAKV